jgi:hypothetical protein
MQVSEILRLNDANLSMRQAVQGPLVLDVQALDAARKVVIVR